MKAGPELSTDPHSHLGVPNWGSQTASVHPSARVEKLCLEHLAKLKRSSAPNLSRVSPTFCERLGTPKVQMGWLLASTVGTTVQTQGHKVGRDSFGTDPETQWWKPEMKEAIRPKIVLSSLVSLSDLRVLWQVQAGEVLYLSGCCQRYSYRHWHTAGEESSSNQTLLYRGVGILLASFLVGVLLCQACPLLQTLYVFLIDRISRLARACRLRTASLLFVGNMVQLALLCRDLQ